MDLHPIQESVLIYNNTMHSAHKEKPFLKDTETFDQPINQRLLNIKHNNITGANENRRTDNI